MSKALGKRRKGILAEKTSGSSDSRDSILSPSFPLPSSMYEGAHRCCPLTKVSLGGGVLPCGSYQEPVWALQGKAAAHSPQYICTEQTHSFPGLKTYRGNTDHV